MILKDQVLISCWILLHITHYLTFNANMLANEMFLDSASLRSSVVSHAKMLGYEVQSPRSAEQPSMFLSKQIRQVLQCQLVQSLQRPMMELLTTL